MYYFIVLCSLVADVAHVRVDTRQPNISFRYCKMIIITLKPEEIYIRYWKSFNEAILPEPTLVALAGQLK